MDDIKTSLLWELNEMGYSNKFDWKEEMLVYSPKNLKLDPTDLFFVDGGYRVDANHIVFAINSPLYAVKGFLELTKTELLTIISKGYAEFGKVDLELYNEIKTDLVINRQYNMRKVRKQEFDPERHELRKNFSDFPPCPYGHTFQALGYDKLKNEYVRFTSSILSDERLKVVEGKN